VEKYIRRCLDAILNQDFDDFEVVLVAETGSTDKSMDICREYVKKDRRVKLYTENGSGFIAARNRGLLEAIGEYISFADADDYILPGALCKMYSSAKENDLDILFCSSKKDYGEGNNESSMGFYAEFAHSLYDTEGANDDIKREIAYKYIINGRSGTVWAKLYRRAFIEDNGFRFIEGTYSDDMAFNIAPCMTAKRIGAVPDPVYVYYDRPGSRIYTSNTDQITKSVEILWKLYLNCPWNNVDGIIEYAVTRLISSMLFNFKLKPIPIETVCETVKSIIDKLGMAPYIKRASDEARFAVYGSIVGMDSNARKNYLLFIRSLENYNDMLKWQLQYKARACSH
jgi:glycosyltransferase involved in cell wall biosynthesis